MPFLQIKCSDSDLIAAEVSKKDSSWVFLQSRCGHSRHLNHRVLTVGCAGAWCAGSHRGLVPSEHPGVTLNCNTLGTAAKAAVVGGSTQTLRAPFSWALTCCWLSQRAPCSPQGTASLGWSTLRLARLQGVTKFQAHLKYATFDPQPQSSVMMRGSYCEWEGRR